jgi:hypothetical protein
MMHLVQMKKSVEATGVGRVENVEICGDCRVFHRHALSHLLEVTL